MDPQAKRSKQALPAFVTRIVNEPADDAAADMCVDLFNRLVQSSATPDRQIYFGLVYAAKVKPRLFRRGELATVLIKFLQSAKPTDTMLSLLACNLLFRGFKDVPEWPLDFVQVYLMDSVQGRNWVDHELAAVFVAGITTVFTANAPVVRYNDSQARSKTHQTTVQLLRENLDRTENVRGLVRALTTLCSYEACRAMAARKMAAAQWLQDVNLSRHAKELFEALCAHVNTESALDLEALQTLLALPQGNLPPSYLSEHRARLLRNNPRYPETALWASLTASDAHFSADALRSAAGAFDSEADAARVAGRLLFRICVQQGALLETAVNRVVTHLPKLVKGDLSVGFLGHPEALTSETLSRFVPAFAALCPPAGVEGLVASFLRIVQPHCLALVHNGFALRPQFESVLARLSFVNDGLCDSLSAMASAVPDLRDTLSSLLLRTYRVALSPAFASVLVQRLLQLNDLNSITLLAILAPQQCGPAALQSQLVRVAVAQIVSGTFTAWSPQQRAQLQADACRSRQPDYVVLALDLTPSHLDVCPPWLAKLAVEDATALTGLNAVQSMRLLLTALIGGSQHPLAGHVPQLARQVTDRTWATVAPALDKLGHCRAAVRGAAQQALELVLGAEWWTNALFAAPENRDAVARLCHRSFEVETDAARLETIRRIAPADVVPDERTSRRRIFRRKVIVHEFVPVPSGGAPAPVAATNWNQLLSLPPIDSSGAVGNGAIVEAPVPVATLTLSWGAAEAARRVDVQFAEQCKAFSVETQQSKVHRRVAASSAEVVRNARQSLVTSANMRYLAERLLQRYESNTSIIAAQPEYAPLDLCGDARAANYARVFQSASLFADADFAALVMAEWSAALTHHDPGVVADAVTHAATLFILLRSNKQRATVRDQLVRTYGPRLTADMLRAFIVAQGFA